MNLKKLFAAAIALLVFSLIAFSVAGTEPWQETGVGGAEDMDTLVVALFTDHVIALEVLGVLLTAAMIGALTIARPLGARDDGALYPHHGVTEESDMPPASVEEEE